MCKYCDEDTGHCCNGESVYFERLCLNCEEPTSDCPLEEEEYIDDEG